MSEHIHSLHCKQLLGNLSDYIDGTIQAELCAEIEKHLKECKNCRIVVDTLRKTIELYEISDLKDQALPADVRDRLFQKLDLNDLINKN